MDNHTVLVLSDPTDPLLALLEELPPETGIAVGDNAEAFAYAAKGASVIFNWSGSSALLREVLAMCPAVRWVHTRSAGLDGVLFPELNEHAVPLTNGKGVFSAPLGEFVLGAILFFAKGMRRMIRSQQAGEWDAFDIEPIAGKTVGIVGYGDIGRAIASRVKAMGMRVVAVRRRVPEEPDAFAERIYPTGRRIEMIRESDYVVVSAPLTEETRGLVGAAELAAMKPGAVIVNIGRGPVIDEGALIEALSGNRIKGAALDVFDTEPLPAGHPFYKLENVLLSAHCADHTPDWLERAMRFFLEQFERFRNGEPLQNVVNKQAGY
jgi:phosphoglycerate dehydrogenase-like enzyme